MSLQDYLNFFASFVLALSAQPNCQNKRAHHPDVAQSDIKLAR